MIILRKWLDDIILIRGQEISYVETFPSLVRLGGRETVEEDVSQLLWTPHGYQIEIHTLGPNVLAELLENLADERLIPEYLPSSEEYHKTGKFKSKDLLEEHLSGRIRIRVNLKWEQIPKILRVLRKFNTVTIPTGDLMFKMI